MTQLSRPARPVLKLVAPTAMLCCPRCGYELDALVMTDSERRVFDALRELQNGTTVATQAIADRALYSHGYTYRTLRGLEQRSLISRPRGSRSGWMIPHKTRLRLIA